VLTQAGSAPAGPTIAIVITLAAVAAVIRVEWDVHMNTKAQERSEKAEVQAKRQREQDAMAEGLRRSNAEELRYWGLDEALAVSPYRTERAIREEVDARSAVRELEAARNSLKGGYGPTTVNDLRKLVAAGEIDEQNAAKRLRRLARAQHHRGYIPTLRAAQVAIAGR